MTTTTTFAGDAVERQVAGDLIRRALLVLPVLVAAAAIGWGRAGATSAAVAVGLVILNFGIAAVSMGWAARISINALMATVLFGFLVRMALITVAVLALKNRTWIAPTPLGITIVLTHLGLLIWETRHLSISLAFPGLKPKRQGATEQ